LIGLVLNTADDTDTATAAATASGGSVLGLLRLVSNTPDRLK
jgi:hypothetical protein